VPRVGGAGRGMLLVAATAAISGVSTFVNGYAVGSTSSDAFVTARNLLVVLLLVPIALVGRRALLASLHRVDALRLVAIGVVGGGVPFLLFFHGLQLASAAGGGALASFYYRTLFLFATVLGVVALGERWPRRAFLGAVLLLGGNLLLLAATGPLWTDGTAFVVAATLLWAVEYTISRRALATVPSGTVALGRMGIGAVVLLLYLAATAQLGAIGAFAPAEWSWIAISAVLLTGFVSCWYAGLARWELGPAASLLVVGFPITWLLTVAFRGAPLTLGQSAGAAAIAVGAALAVGAPVLRAAAGELARLRRPLSAPSR
jgi:drug/metabolite transporter (DMT)-like permease